MRSVHINSREQKKPLVTVYISQAGVLCLTKCYSELQITVNVSKKKLKFKHGPSSGQYLHLAGSEPHESISILSSLRAGRHHLHVGNTRLCSSTACYYCGLFYERDNTTEHTLQVANNRKESQCSSGGLAADPEPFPGAAKYTG